MKIFTSHIVFVFFIGLISSCQLSLFKDPAEDPVLVTAYGKSLRKSEIPFTFSELPLSKQDSEVFIQTYINTWIESQVMLNKSEINVDQEYLELVNQKVVDYRNSLMIYEYEKKLILQNIDTTISNDDIQEYYEKNTDNFNLNDPIVRCLFLKVNKKSTVLEEFSKHYQLKNAEDSVFIHDMAKLEAEKYMIDFQQWKPVEYVISELPIADKITDVNVFLDRNRLVEMQDNQYVYFLHVLDYRKQGQNAPLSYIEEKIRLMILNKRKYEYLNIIRKRLVESAITKSEVNLYVK